MGNYLREIIAGAAIAALAVGCGPVEDGSVEAPPVQAQSQSLAALSGVVLDWNDQPVAFADVALAINGQNVTEKVQADAHGAYRLDIPVDAVREAERRQQEVTLLFWSPLEDRGKAGTVEGDRVHLLPVTLREFIDMNSIADEAEITVRPAYVPLQAKGYEITEELVREGGELTWDLPESPVGGALRITVVIEPNSIKVDGDDPQDEITLTVLDAERAPMQVLQGGYGVLWTIQPRDIRFDPPAKLRLEGDRLPMVGLADIELGNPFQVFGATLDRGWVEYGNVFVAGVTDTQRLVLESSTGIIHRGAWGHVLSDPNADAGALITCYDYEIERYVSCAQYSVTNILQPLMHTRVARTQRDYPGVVDSPFWYTDLESVCSGCSNIGVPGAQMATGLTMTPKSGDVLCSASNTPGCIPDAGDPMRFWVRALCADEAAMTDINARNELLNSRDTFVALAEDPDELDTDEARALWEEFVANDPNAPADVVVNPGGQFSYAPVLCVVQNSCGDGNIQTGWAGPRPANCPVLP